MNKYFIGLITKKQIAPVIITMACLFFAASAYSNELIDDQQRAYSVELGKYKQTNNKIKRLNTAIRASEAELEEREKEKVDAAAALEKIQSIDRENPSLGLSDKVQEAQARNRRAFSDYRQSEKDVKQLRRRVIPLDTELKDSSIILNSLAREIGQLNDQMVATELDKRIAKLNNTKTVEGYSEVGCGEESARKCQQRALSLAKRDASEKGSIVVVQAITHIDNFQLTKDQVKTNVRAQLSDVEILKKGWIGDSTYQYHIRAQVTPVIGADLKAQIEESVSQELGVFVPPIITLGVTPVSRPQRIVQKTAAERSFDELDRETGHRKTVIEKEERLPRNRVVAKTKSDEPKKESNSQVESWYILSGLSVGSASYPSGFDSLESDAPPIGFDLGVYWPITDSSIYGFVWSSVAEQFSYFDVSESEDVKFTVVQGRFGLSTLNFLGKSIGKGFFLRGDIGMAIVTLSDDGEDGFDESSDLSWGLLAGAGYSLPVGSDSRILFAVNYAMNNASFSEDVTSAADGTYSTVMFNVSGLW